MLLHLMLTLAAAQQPDWNREIGERDVPDYLDGSPLGWGAGIYAGSNGIGLAGSYSMPQSITQAVVVWSMPETLRLTVDQHVQVYSVRRTEYLTFPITLGLGVYGHFNEVEEKHLQGDSIQNRYGIRAPIMMLMNNENLACDVYGELVPSWQAYPVHQQQFHIDGGIGARIYF